jgi:hypothetical protein
MYSFIFFWLNAMFSVILKDTRLICDSVYSHGRKIIWEKYQGVFVNIFSHVRHVFGKQSVNAKVINSFSTITQVNIVSRALIGL